MSVARRSTRSRFTLVVLILLSLTFITLDLRGGGPIPSLRGKVRDAFAPIQSAVSSLTSPVTDFFQGVFDYQELRDDNTRLRAQLAAASAQQIEDQYLEQTNKDLTDLLKLDFVGDIPTVAARVIAGSGSNFQLTIVIDRGEDAGVLQGMPVVAGTGLVGRVIATSASQSTVLLLTDPSASVGVQFAPTPAIGVATGQGTGRQLSVTLIDPNAPVTVGTVAVTSGLAGSPYPSGIPVGTVTSAVMDAGVQARDVTLAPVVDVSRLSYVDVLISTAQTPSTHPTPTTLPPGNVSAAAAASSPTPSPTPSPAPSRR